MPVDFSGTWELEKTENVDEYLDSLGIADDMKAQLKARKVKVVVEHDGKDFKVRNDLGIETEGKIGEEYDQVTVTGAKLRNFASWEGEKLVVKTTSVDHKGKEHITIRELKDDKIIQVNRLNEGPEAIITLKRVIKDDDNENEK